MIQCYQDSMAVVSATSPPDLFVTFTCNPLWPEITDNLYPGQTASDRPDLVSRVFKLKLDELRNDLFNNGVLGRVVARLYVIEFQKRGLPHAHILIILDPDDKPRSPADIDDTVSAQIPDPTLFPELHQTITTCMIHACSEKRCLDPETSDDFLLLSSLNSIPLTPFSSCREVQEALPPCLFRLNLRRQRWIPSLRSP